MRCRRVKIAHAFASACSRVCDRISAVELLESRRLLSGPTGATALSDIFAPGDVLISTAAHVGDWGYFFERDPSTTTARLWRTDGSPAGTSPTDVTFTVTDGVGPTSLISFNGQLLFVASDPTLGRELWLSDGTAAGTHAASNFADPSAQPQNLTISGAQAFFTLTDSTFGTELWHTDGSSGAVIVADIRPGASSSTPSMLTAMGGAIYFVANDGVHGSELWRSNGTAAGTQLVADITPGANGTQLLSLFSDGSRLYFSALAGGVGSELWSSDGTTAGTALLKDIRPGINGSTPHLFTSFNNFVYFTAFDDTHGEEVWRTDGTAAGTVFAAELIPGASNSGYSAMVGAGSHLFVTNFSGDMWSTPGTTAGSVYLSMTDAPQQLHAVGGRLVYTDAPYSSGAGQELWVSDGTLAGTHVLRDIAAGRTSSSPSQLSVLDPDTMLFAAQDLSDGAGPWVTDGTANGTVALPKTAAAPVQATNVLTIKLAGDRLYVEATYPSAYSGFTPTGLWVTNGRPGGARLLQARTGTTFFVPAADGRLFFSDYDGIGVTDGTVFGTVHLHSGDVPDDFVTGQLWHVAMVDDTFYFLQAPATGVRELWKSDGTVGGTVKVRTFTEGDPSGDAPAYLSSVNGKLLFYAHDSAHGFEPWVSDGTAAGTFMLKDIYPGRFGSNLVSTTSSFRPAVAGSRAYFIAEDGTNHNGLWTTDGTPAGTYLITNLLAPSISRRTENIPAAASDGATLYFVYFDTSSTRGVFRTNGTAAATQLVRGGFTGSTPIGFFNGRLFVGVVGAAPGLTSYSLYENNGTPGDPFELLQSFDNGGVSPSPTNITAGYDGVYFGGTTNDQGRELWYSNGDPGSGAAGTHLVADVVAGAAASDPKSITPSVSSTFFIEAGQLWVTPPASADAVGIRSAIGAGYSFSGPAGSQTLTISGGLVEVTEDALNHYPNLTIHVNAGASVQFDTTQHLAALVVDGRAEMAASAGATLVMDALDVGPEGVLDLRGGSLILHYATDAVSPLGSWNGSAYTGVTGLIASGRNGGTWSGSGIVTSMSAANAGNTLTTIAIAEASEILGISGSETALWNGETVDATTVILKYTYGGDANLDGVVNGDDYVQMDSAFPQALHGWLNGDFNYDGFINGDDYFLIDSNFPAQQLPL